MRIKITSWNCLVQLFDNHPSMGRCLYFYFIILDLLFVGYGCCVMGYCYHSLGVMVLQSGLSLLWHEVRVLRHVEWAPTYGITVRHHWIKVSWYEIMISKPVLKIIWSDFNPHWVPFNIIIALTFLMTSIHTLWFYIKAGSLFEKMDLYCSILLSKKAK